MYVRMSNVFFGDLISYRFYISIYSMIIHPIHFLLSGNVQLRSVCGIWACDIFNAESSSDGRKTCEHRKSGETVRLLIFAFLFEIQVPV